MECMDACSACMRACMHGRTYACMCGCVQICMYSRVLACVLICAWCELASCDTFVRACMHAYLHVMHAGAHMCVFVCNLLP